MPIIHSNPGLVDMTAITTMGVSVKENENPIGYFGTGFKYAIATLLRFGAKVTLFRGEEQIQFVPVSTSVRGQDFDVVHMVSGDGPRTPLGFTTNLGRNWELWQAFRELHSNALDEGGGTNQVFDPPKPIPGETQIVVFSRDYEATFALRDEIFLPLTEMRPAFQTSHCTIYARPSTSYFYRGVRAGKLPNSSRFTYNITMETKLTEDRTIAHTFMADATNMSVWGQCPKEDLLIQAWSINNEHEDYEASNIAPLFDPGYLSLECATAVANIQEEGEISLRASLVAAAQTKLHRNFRFRATTLAPFQEEILEKAINFCCAMGYNVEKLEIIIAETLGPGVLGKAKDNTIFLSILAFDKGTQTVAGTLIEEFLHIRMGYNDCTRQFQNYLIDQLVVLGQKQLGIVL